MGNSPELNFLFKSISRFTQHLVKISYILEHYSKKNFFASVFLYPGLVLDISLLETLPKSIFFWEFISWTVTSGTIFKQFDQLFFTESL